MTATAENAMAEVPAVRQAVYRFLRGALEPPSPEQHEWMRGAAFASSLGQAAEAFGVGCPEGELVPEDYSDHESRYLACFEVGMPGPPVPLLASHYQKREPAPRVIHEHILFYRHFGLTGPDRHQAQADHLVHQLDFLIHLDELIRQDRVDARSALWARQDFLSRHLQRWAAEASRQPEEKRLPAVYRTLLAVLAAAAAEDREQTALGRASAEGER